jgi:hypothetical protein
MLAGQSRTLRSTQSLTSLTILQKAERSSLGKLGRFLIISISRSIALTQASAWVGKHSAAEHSWPVISVSHSLVLLMDSWNGPLHVRLLLVRQPAVSFHIRQILA